MSDPARQATPAGSPRDRGASAFTDRVNQQPVGSPGTVLSWRQWQIRGATLPAPTCARHGAIRWSGRPGQTMNRDARPRGREGGDSVGLLSWVGGVEQRQLVGLITRRSSVRIRPPQPVACCRESPGVPPPGVFLLSRLVSPRLGRRATPSLPSRHRVVQARIDRGGRSQGGSPCTLAVQPPSSELSCSGFRDHDARGRSGRDRSCALHR